MSDDSYDAQMARQATDGHIQQMLMSGAPSEYYYRKCTHRWLVRDYDRATEKCETVTYEGYPTKDRAECEKRLVILRRLRKERVAKDAFDEMEEREIERHSEVQAQLGRIEKKIESAAKPHWTTVPTFWIVAAGAILTFCALLFGLL